MGAARRLEADSFHADNDDGSDRLELYNLRDDVSETKNLAAEQPELAVELNSLISGFLKETDAVVPVRKPAFGGPETAAPKAPLLGWKVRQCSAVVRDDSLVITATGADPFLGFAAGKLPAGAKLRFRIRRDERSGRVAWLPTPNAKEAPTPETYQVTPGEFAEVTVPIPAPGDKTGIIRLYLPAPAELDWIELNQPPTKPRRWDFGGK